MRTRARAWAIRAAVVAVVTAAGVVGVSTPALAAPLIVNFVLSTNSITAGQQVTATWTVRTADEDGEVVDVRVESNNQQLQCTGGQCNVIGATISPDGTDFSATFTATGVFSNQVNAQIKVTAGNQQSAPQPLTIRPTPTVPEVKGTVTDVLTGQPVKDARVAMTDSANTRWENIGTGEDGGFVITSTPDKPITAGQLRFEVSKDGIDPFTSGTFTGVADQPLTNVSLRVKVNTTASATTSAPPSITASGVDTGTPAGPTTAPVPEESGLSGFAILMIVIGGVLVLGGIGAIVFLFVRRNNDDDGPPYGPGGPGGPGGRGGPGRGGPPPPGQRRPGPPDRTQPMRPGYGPPRPVAPGARDQTMIARSPLADAPTQMHGRPGAPQPPHSAPPARPPHPGGGGYGPPPAGYGQQPGYGGPPPAGYPPQQAGYGAGPGGYGPPRPGADGYTEPRPGGRATEGRRVDWMDD